jgi:hypothetical protein
MEMMAEKTIWDTKIAGEGYSHRLSYKEPGPLEGCPGSDAYFTAIMAENRRAAEARSISKQVMPPMPRWKGPVARTSAGQVTSQLCERCDRRVRPGKGWATVKWPTIWCAPCGVEVEEKLRFGGNSRFEENYGKLVEVEVIS